MLLNLFCVCTSAAGMIMFTSWINVAGRIFATRLTSDFTCHTYPVYKPMNTTQFAGAEAPLTLVPTDDPDYDKAPWAKMGIAAWGVAMSIGPLAGAALVGAVFSYVAVVQMRRRSRPSPQHPAAIEAGVADKDSQVA
eukprot:GHRR01036121.1.p1 GENE.GHRR01036121.1~~GHRR01036121.1.p1  ORF type:complete len:137 (-),score=32.68 GHRR01036121.1:238-648(-)